MNRVWQGGPGLLRRFAENTLGGIRLKRRLPEHAGGGTIFVSGRAGGMKYLLKSCDSWDPDLLNAAHRLVRPGAEVWDIGANVGLFARASAFHAGPEGHVLCIEADVDVIQLLMQTARVLGSSDAPMTIVPLAAGSGHSLVQFSIARRARASNFIHGHGGSQTGGVLEQRTIPCLDLDSLLSHFRPPDVLKVDVEGAELLVLQGGVRIVSEIRPVFYIEVSSANRARFTEIFSSNCYKMYQSNRFGAASRPVLNCSANTIAIPSEKVGICSEV